MRSPIGSSIASGPADAPQGALPTPGCARWPRTPRSTRSAAPVLFAVVADLPFENDAAYASLPEESRALLAYWSH